MVATARTIRPSARPGPAHRRRRHRRPGDRRADHRRSAGTVRPHRHPGQQRRRLPVQAVHRLHRRRLRHGRRGQPGRVLLGDPAGHRRDGEPGTAATWSTSRPPWPRSRTPGAPAVAGRADQGRPGGGHQVAGHRVRLAAASGSTPSPRASSRHRCTRPESYDEPRRPAAPLGRVRPGQRRRERHLVPGVIALHHRRDPAHRRRPEFSDY